MADDRADLDVLMARLRDAAERLKAAEPGPEPERTAALDPSPPPRAPAAPGPPPARALSETLQALEAAGAAVRDARLRVAELQARIGDS